MSARLRTAGTHRNLSWHKRTCTAIRRLNQTLKKEKTMSNPQPYQRPESTDEVDEQLSDIGFDAATAEVRICAGEYSEAIVTLEKIKRQADGIIEFLKMCAG